MVTKLKDLRTGRSVWEGRRSRSVRYRLLDRDIENDVLVVGAGITGAMVADALLDAGLTVTLVDRRRHPATGSTTASTALVQYEVDTPLSLLSRKIGKAAAMRAWRRSRIAVDAIGARLGELEVPDVVRRNGIYLAGDMLDADGLLREHYARGEAGLASRLLTRKALRERYGIARQAALMGFDNLTLDPRKTTLALLAAPVERGARIFAPVKIVDIHPGPHRVTATIGNGRRIRSRHLVFATGYELPKNIPARGHQINSTFAIATVPQPGRLWPEQCMIWEASDPYLYLRTTPEGRIICGGEDEEFSDEGKRDALLVRKTKTLQRKLRKLFPKVDTSIDFAWTGSFGSTDTGLPIIGEIPRMSRCWVALGYGGNGITYSRIAADIIAGALTGRPDMDADLYDFKTKRR